MVTLTITVPSCRNLRTYNGLIIRVIVVCATLWLFFTTKDALRPRRETCDSTRYNSRVHGLETRHQCILNVPGYPEEADYADHKSEGDHPGRRLVGHVSQSEVDERRITTMRDDTAKTPTERPGRRHADRQRRNRLAKENHYRTKHLRNDNRRDLDAEREEHRSFPTLDDNTKVNSVDSMTTARPEGLSHTKHDARSHYSETDRRQSRQISSGMEGHDTNKADGYEHTPDKMIHRSNEHISFLNKKTYPTGHEERSARETKDEIYNTEYVKNDGRHVGFSSDQLTVSKQDVGTTNALDDEKQSRTKKQRTSDYGHLGTLMRDREDGESFTSTASSEDLFTIANGSRDSDTLYYHRHLPPITGLLPDKEEEKHPLPDHEVTICSQRQRQLHLRDNCQQLLDEDKERRTYRKRRLKLVAINHEKKLLYCMLPKTGTRSWLTFLVNLTSGLESARGLKIRDAQFMSEMGIEYRRNLHLYELESRYKHYTRFVVVRHPLQRFASAYYESVVKNGKFRKEDGSTPSFREFAAAFAGDRLRPHVQTARYINHCQVCRMRYDYLLKAETIRSDFHLFRSDLGTAATLPREHVNRAYKLRHHTDVFKYDALLRTLQPGDTDILRGLMTVYEADNKIFGYGWDFDNRRSTCSAMQGDKRYPCC